MADFLFEIGLEEVPARMVAGAQAERIGDGEELAGVGIVGGEHVEADAGRGPPHQARRQRLPGLGAGRAQEVVADAGRGAIVQNFRAASYHI